MTSLFTTWRQHVRARARPTPARSSRSTEDGPVAGLGDSGPRPPEELLQPRPQLIVHVSPLAIAQALWDYGEDALWERALGMSDDEHADVRRICAWYEDPRYPLPLVGQRITHHHVNAFAAITLFEGSVRPLARSRRRPQKGRPDALRD